MKQKTFLAGMILAVSFSGTSFAETNSVNVARLVELPPKPILTQPKPIQPERPPMKTGQVQPKNPPKPEAPYKKPVPNEQVRRPAPNMQVRRPVPNEPAKRPAPNMHQPPVNSKKPDMPPPPPPQDKRKPIQPKR